MECIAMSQGDRIRTFIHGFDDKLGGGIPEGHVVLVVDSLPVLEVMSRFQNPREDLFQLFEWIRDLKATTILISEMKPGSEDFGKNGEEYLSDGIIHTKMERVDDANIQRRIRCVKLRGTNHSPNYYTLIFQSGILHATRIIAE